MAPALSKDGRILAFYRTDNWFITPDQIYIKMLPNGEAVQLTHNNKWKYGLAFSPDNSRIAYTTSERGAIGWKTYTVPVLGWRTQYASLKRRRSHMARRTPSLVFRNPNR